MKAPVACSLLLLLLFSSRALAMDVAPVLDNGQLGVAITAIRFPETLAKDLASGLTNKLLVRVALVSDSQSVAQRAIEISVKYDLWDEKFRLILQIDNSTSATSVYDNAHDVIQFLTTLKLPRLFAVNGLGRADFTLRIDMLLNPIERERMDKIRNWVTDNSTYLPGDVGGFGSGKVGNSRSNALFNKIFEQYFAGADIAAGWKETAMSGPFKLQDIANVR